MRKIIFAIVVIISVFTLLSFLVDKNKGSGDLAFIYFQRNLKNREIILNEATRLFKNQHFKTVISPFDIKDIDSYIISNGKRSIFITETAPKSTLFRLKNINYNDILVPVTNYKNYVNSVDYDTAVNIFKTQEYEDYGKIIKDIISNKKSFALVPYGLLSLKLKPLEVSGIFPTISEIKKGVYPLVISCTISTKSNRLYHFIKKNIKNADYSSLFSMIAGGDIMLDRGVKKYIDIYGAKYPFKYIKDEIQNHEIAFANLESPLTTSSKKYKPNKGIYFRARPEYADILKWSGFDILSVSNNHILDWSDTGALDTVKYLKRAGINYNGIAVGKEQKIKPSVIDVKGTKVCFIAINDIYPVSYQSGKYKVETYTYSKDLLKILKNFSKRYDITVISYHTGIEYLKEPEKSKVERMRTLIESGADIVLGGHPHVVQRIEVYNDSIIAYSLGNLIFDQNWSEETSTGLLLEIGFLKNKILYFHPLKIKIIKGQARIYDKFRDLQIVLNNRVKIQE